MRTPVDWWRTRMVKAKMRAAGRAFLLGQRALSLEAEGYRDTLAHKRTLLAAELQRLWVEVWESMTPD